MKKIDEHQPHTTHSLYTQHFEDPQKSCAEKFCLLSHPDTQLAEFYGLEPQLCWGKYEMTICNIQAMDTKVWSLYWSLVNFLQYRLHSLQRSSFLLFSVLSRHLFCSCFFYTDWSRPFFQSGTHYWAQCSVWRVVIRSTWSAKSHTLQVISSKVLSEKQVILTPVVPVLVNYLR